jgi:predicted dehydrogenase
MARGIRLSRRKFLGAASAAAAGAFLGPYVLAPASRGAEGRPAPSERLALGAIGLGNQGMADLKEFLYRPQVQVLAVCDVDKNHLAGAKEAVDGRYSNKACLATADFREIVGRKDIDAIMIATPDHWHAIPVIEAARAGKHIHCQKPLGLTLGQGRAMSNAVRRAGVVFQTGSQQRSDSRFRLACELALNGRLGQLQRVEVGLPKGETLPLQPPAAVPPELDYDRWLGPAPWAPYTPKRVHGTFRLFYDYSGGMVTDWGAHHCDIAQWGMGATLTGPAEVEGTGEFPRDGLSETPVTFRVECRYVNGVVMIVSTDFPNGVKFVGADGWVFVDRGRIAAEPKEMLAAGLGPNERRLYESKDHKTNFLDCIRSGKPTVAPIEEAHRSAACCHLCNIALRLGRKVRWSPVLEEFVDDLEADRMISRAMRAPWRL